MEKVAIYVREGLPAHVSRQLPSGECTSKCADLEEIVHTSAGLEGTLYGTVSFLMKRKLGTATYFAGWPPLGFTPRRKRWVLQG